MTTSQPIHIIGSASGIGGKCFSVSLGPVILQESPFIKQLPITLQWQTMLYAKPAKPHLAALPQVKQLCQQIAEHSYALTQQNKFTLTLGGDQTCSIGTWSGVAAAKRKQGPIGLIWVDAHMDSHTPATSETGNIHGMALAALLGHGDPSLTTLMDDQPKLLAEHVCIIGARSYESGEAELLKQLKVRVFFMDEVKQHGMENILQQAIALVSQNSCGYGISIDLDAIDPNDAPGVSVPEAGGIAAADLLTSLTTLQTDANLIAAEIVEFNPNNDIDQKTEQIIAEIIQRLRG